MLKKHNLETWWDSLDPQTKTYLKKQPVWHSADMIKSAAVAGAIGFIVGVIVGYEWAWKPVIQTFKPLIG
jgi:hypothetical protein